MDVDCRTGALPAEVLRACSPAAVLGVDPSAAFVTRAATHVDDPQAARAVGSAQALPVADASVDAVVSGPVLDFLPNRPAALAEMRRGVRPSGPVAACVWDHAGGMQLMRRFRDAAAERDPAAHGLDQGVYFPGCRPELLRTRLPTADDGTIHLTARAWTVCGRRR
ncbi:hypothetical protein DQ238_19175 [Geodermatophilus sp. TF02-6]|uniref:methyltransferase domain-containing protein n=1 Tax=Geodermatophilus sp. TF02-6 TaxID=2250575 RepID=UPI000DE9A8A4|nr:methyltransferase domain-containing protein [Geodermatophilus sp. TF02-6]RBY75751.1 hypothetical protein DQ238_19175 [Geodermatophilus sp. TF02-6]